VVEPTVTKSLGFLSFGHWSQSPFSKARSAGDSLLQAIDLAQGFEELGGDGAYFRVHHYAHQHASPFPLLSAIGAKTSRIEIGTGVIDMRYENPFYMTEDAGAADLISGGRLQLGVSRGSPEQVIDGWRHFGYAPADDDDQDGARLAREKTELFLKLINGGVFAQPNPRPMFPNPHGGPLGLEPQSPGLRDRIWWGAGSDATARWAAEQGMNLQTSTLKWDEHTGEPLHVQQRKQIEAFREAWAAAGWEREPRVSVSRSIFALVDERDWQFFGSDRASDDQVGWIDAETRAIFGRSYAGSPDELIPQLQQDEAIAAADSLLLTIPSQLGVEYNLHALGAILEHVAPELGWR
jgi:alkanesulfonate monooxygenase SsuD/methylene tetrahydromethanopterin reductase-like flavin-dependent oxidoreductase (luciferase family)